MSNPYASYRFGDIVVNHWASDTNPTKRGIVVRVTHKERGVNSGYAVECTDGKGKFWKYGGGPEKLEIVGSALRR